MTLKTWVAVSDIYHILKNCFIPHFAFVEILSKSLHDWENMYTFTKKKLQRLSDIAIDR